MMWFGKPRQSIFTQNASYGSVGSVAAHAVVEFVVPAMILNSAFWSMQMPSKTRSRIYLGTPKNHKNASSNQYWHHHPIPPAIVHFRTICLMKECGASSHTALHVVWLGFRQGPHSSRILGSRRDRKFCPLAHANAIKKNICFKRS